MFGIGRPDKKIVTGVDSPSQLLEPFHHLVYMLQRRQATALCRPRRRIAVFIGASKEKNIITQLPVIARQNIGGNRRVGGNREFRVGYCLAGRIRHI